MRKASKLLRSLFVLACFLFLWSVTGCPHPIEPEPTNVTVTFESNGGSAVESITIEKGNSIEKPADPIKNGYVFSGWYIGTSKIEFPYTPEDNVTLQAAWNLEVYSIEYVLSELATNDSSNPTEYTIESEEIKVEDLKAPALKTGAKFLGWYEDEEFKTKFDSIKTGSTGNVKIYGKITDGPTYTVIYYLPGDATAKTEVVAEKDVFTLTGYDLYTDKDWKNPYDGAEITENITLYAKAKMFKVTFDPANGSAPTVVECEYNKAVKVPSEGPIPIDNKTFFAGWYLGDKQYDFEKPITGDIKLTAKWNKPFEKVTQLNNMPVISITANYLATSDEEDKYKEKNVNDFVKLPVAKSVKEQEKDWGGTAYANAPVPFYKESTISVLDENGNVTLKEVAGQVKVRGNWTTTYPKKPLRIKFDKKQSMLGLNEGNEFKNWVLLASYKDRSFLRDITGFTLGKLIAGENYYASDFKLVEVYVNGEYLGVYVLAEQQEVKEDRININDAEENPSNDTGYLIEYDSYYKNEDSNTTFTIEHGQMTDKNGEAIIEFNRGQNILSAGYTIKNDLNNVSQKEYVANYMQKLWDDCYNAVYNDTEENAQRIVYSKIDIDSLVATYLLSEIVCDPDLYLTSFFMTLDLSKADAKLTFQAPWDFDSTMGNKRQDANEQGLYAGVVGHDVNYERKGTGNPWMILLAKQEWFNKIVQDKWNNLKDPIFSNVTSQISTLTSKYATNFENNYKKWPMEPNDEYRPEAEACKTQSAAANQLVSWLNGRKESLEKGINEFTPKDFTKDENDYFYAEATENGILVKFFLPEGVTLPDRYSANIVESTTGMELSLSSGNWGEEVGTWPDVEWIWSVDFTKDNAIEVLFPFVEKDEQYTFNFSGMISSQNDWFVSPSVTVKATDTVKPFDFTDFKTSNTTCEIKPEGDVSFFEIKNDKAESTKASIKTECGYDTRDIYSGLWGYAGYAPGTWAWGNPKQPINHDVLKCKGNYNTYAVGYNIEVVVGDGTHPYGWKSPCVWSENYNYPESAPQPWDVWYNGNVFNNYYSYPLENLLIMAEIYGLEENTDYTLDVPNKRIILTESGCVKINEGI